MSDLGDILAKKSLPHEPAEFPAIRRFVQDNFDVSPRLQLRENSIIISVPGSAVAGSLRFQLHDLQDQIDTERQLVIASY
jgi:hypothetical protein